jgi:hypothetical protein
MMPEENKYSKQEELPRERERGEGEGQEARTRRRNCNIVCLIRMIVEMNIDEPLRTMQSPS